VPDEKARTLAEKLGVQIRRYDIIYQVTDDLKAALQGMLKPEKQEKDLAGHWCSGSSTSAAWGLLPLPRAGRNHPARRRVRVIRDSR